MDNDLRNLKCHDPELINITLDDKRKIMMAIKSDVEFLTVNNLVDYSLLLTIEDTKNKTGN